MPNGRNKRTRRKLLCKIGIWWIKSSIFYSMMNKLKQYRLVILLCVLFFLLGILACQIDYEKWSPKNSSDLAAWVQAIGATVGLGVAIWLSGAPYRQEKKNAVVSVRYFAKSLVEITTSFRIGLQDNKIATIALSNIALAEAIQSIRSVRSELLPTHAMNAFAAIRSIAAQLSEIAKRYEGNQTADNNSDFLKFLEHIVRYIDGASRMLHSNINGVPSEEFSYKEISERVMKSSEDLKKMAG